jgi:hypothetical protein
MIILDWAVGLCFILALAFGLVAGWVSHREFGRDLRRGPQIPQERRGLPATPVHPALPERRPATILAGHVHGITGAAGSRAITRDGS